MDASLAGSPAHGDKPSRSPAKPSPAGSRASAFNDQIQTLTGVSQGCSPLPGGWRITKAQDTLIEKIDGRPAIEVFREAAGPALGADLRRAVSNLLVGLTDDDADRRQFTARRIVAVDVRSGRLAINASVEKGQSMVFLQRDEEAARTDLARMLKELQDACPASAQGRHLRQLRLAWRRHVRARRS